MISCFLEGTDLIGKTTTAKLLSQIIKTTDRHKEFTNLINFNGTLKNDKKIYKVLSSLEEKEYIVILYTSDDNILKERLLKRTEKIDKFDKKTVIYNNSYKYFFKIKTDKLVFVDIVGKEISEIVKEILGKLIQKIV